jgi:hypothetical protein
MEIIFIAVGSGDSGTKLSLRGYGTNLERMAGNMFLVLINLHIIG